MFRYCFNNNIWFSGCASHLKRALSGFFLIIWEARNTTGLKAGTCAFYVYEIVLIWKWVRGFQVYRIWIELGTLGRDKKYLSRSFSSYAISILIFMVGVRIFSFFFNVELYAGLKYNSSKRQQLSNVTWVLLQLRYPDLDQNTTRSTFRPKVGTRFESNCSIGEETRVKAPVHTKLFKQLERKLCNENCYLF